MSIEKRLKILEESYERIAHALFELGMEPCYICQTWGRGYFKFNDRAYCEKCFSFPGVLEQKEPEAQIAIVRFILDLDSKGKISHNIRLRYFGGGATLREPWLTSARSIMR